MWNTLGIVFVTIPFIRYLINGGVDIADLLATNSLHAAPWVYFEIVAAVVVVLACTNSAAIIVCIFIAVTFTGIAQLQLAEMAFLTIDRRVSKAVDDRGVPPDEAQRVIQKLTHEEIKSCAMHYKAIYRYVLVGT